MKFAQFSIKHKVATTLAAILVVIFGYMCYNQLPLALMPSMEVKMAVVVTSYQGAGPEEVENLVTRIVESACASVSGLDELSSTSSEGMSMVMVEFTDDTDLDQAVTDLRDKVSSVEARLPDDADSPSVMKMDPDAMPVVTIGLTGDDLAGMQSTAEDDIGPYLERLAGVASVDVRGGYENEVEINTYTDRLEGYGITVDYLAGILARENSTVAGGDIESGSQTLNVRTDGEYLSVEDVPQSISRENQSRTVTISGDSASGNTMSLNQQVQQVLATINVPDGITISTAGQMSEMGEQFGSLGFALIVALGLVYFVLAAQYESFLLPVMIMMIMPISLLGSMVGLPLTGNPISMTAVLGVIILAGTVVNSSIVLVDYIEQRRARGEDKNTAILNACPRRVRPIMMTTTTTLLGLMPMVLGAGEGSEMMRPMAIVMFFGMIISTIVTLLFTPVFYSLLSSLSDRVNGRRELRRRLRREKRRLRRANKKPWNNPFRKDR